MPSYASYIEVEEIVELIRRTLLLVIFWVNVIFMSFLNVVIASGIE